jgi:hypothetical protein
VTPEAHLRLRLARLEAVARDDDLVTARGDPLVRLDLLHLERPLLVTGAEQAEKKDHGYEAVHQLASLARRR